MRTLRTLSEATARNRFALLALAAAGEPSPASSSGGRGRQRSRWTLIARLTTGRLRCGMLRPAPAHTLPCGWPPHLARRNLPAPVALGQIEDVAHVPRTLAHGIPGSNRARPSPTPLTGRGIR